MVPERRKSQSQQQLLKVHPDEGLSPPPAAQPPNPATETQPTTAIVDAPDVLGQNKEFLIEETTHAADSISKWWRVRRLHQRIQRKWTPDHLRRVRERERQRRVQGRLCEVFFYVIYLLFLNDAMLAPFSHASLFLFTTNIKHLFMHSTFVDTATNATLSFDDIRTPAHVHRWLQGPFHRTLFAELTNASSPAPTYSLLEYGQVLGQVTVGQLRVSRHDCTASNLPAKGVNNNQVEGADTFWCYGTSTGHFDKSVESTAPFGSGDNFVWDSDATVTTTRSMFFTSFTSRMTDMTYPAPAYRVAVASNDPSQASRVLASLKALSYVDAFTRAVFVDVNVLNAMLSSVLVLRFAFEFPPSGGVVATVESALAPYVDTSFNFKTNASFIVVCVFLAADLFLLLRATRKDGWLAYLRLDAWARLGVFVSFGIMWLLQSTAALDLPTTDSMASTTFRPYAFMQTVSTRVGAAICFFSYVRLILLFDFLPQVALIVQTITASVTTVTSLLFVFGLLVYAYASCFCLIFGSSVHGFSTVTQSYTSLLRSLVGDIDYAELRASSPAMAAFVFVCFTLVAVFIILHIVIAMVLDAYWTAKDSTEWEQVNVVTDVLSIVWLLGHQMVRGIASLFGLLGVLSHHHDETESNGGGSSRRKRRMDIRNLTAVQKLVAQPLLTTQTTLARLGHALTQKQLTQSSLRHQMTNLLGVNQQRSSRKDVKSPTRRRSLHPQAHKAGRQTSHDVDVVHDDTQIKVLQGMVLQLAHQNTKMQQTLDVVQAHLTELLDQRDGDDDHFADLRRRHRAV
ncbi:unnamed protein product [Aphanomyces euteiches]